MILLYQTIKRKPTILLTAKMSGKHELLTDIKTLLSGRGSLIIEFEYHVTVLKSLFDADEEMHPQLAKYNSIVQENDDRDYDLRIPYRGPDSLPFCQVDRCRREAFKESFLSTSDDTTYTFKLVNWCRVHRIKSYEMQTDKQIVTVGGLCSDQIITDTHYSMQAKGPTGTFIFGPDGKFLSCTLQRA